MRHPIAIVVLFVLGALVRDVGLAQGERASRPEDRPKIGLVLSGGGARGVSHIGVLKALERLRIPVDYIAGTSMGAIVGGLYASGMSPEELEDWFRTADWHDLLSDVASRRTGSSHAKERDFTMRQNLELEIDNGGVQLPSGIVKGRKLLATLRQLTLPVLGIEDFDALPVPFRAVATDIENGEPVILRRGDLASSIRASMAVPGIFEPVVIDDRLLVDGGLTYNLPVQIVRDMGADIVIAVDVRPELRTRDELDSAPAIANQMLDLFITRETLKQVALLGDRDVYIRLPLEGVSSSSFETAWETIPTGLNRAMEKRDALERYAVPEEAYRNYLAWQRIAREPSVEVDFVAVEMPEGKTETARLESPVNFSPGSREDLTRLEEAIRGSRALRGYTVRGFRIVEENGRYGIVLAVDPVERGTTFISVGFDFAFSTSQQTEANLLLSYRMTELNALGGEWASFVSLGDSTRVESEFHQPLDADRQFFLVPNVAYSLDFINGRNGADDRIRFRLQTERVGLAAGIRLWQAGAFTIGYTRGASQIGQTVGPVGTDGDVRRGYAEARLVLDTLDSPGFPASGYYADVRARLSDRSLGGSDNYAWIDVEAYAPLVFGENTLLPRVVAGLNPGGGALPIYDQFSLGGFLNLSGLADGDLYDRNVLLGELVYYRKIGSLPPGLGRGLYAGLSVEAGGAWPEIGDIGADDLQFAGSVFLGGESVLGPLFLGIGVAEGGNVGVYLQLSPMFRQGRIRDGSLRTAP